MNWLIAILQTALFVALAPLLAGWLKRCKCHLQNRQSPPLLQPYRDLFKLFNKQPVVSEQASWLFIKAPYIIFSATVLAATVVPLIAVDLPTSASADVIVMVGFF
ncbi:MAG: NADH-quinone oxidoreductase subunit H, partial [Methylococcales bacterium]